MKHLFMISIFVVAFACSTKAQNILLMDQQQPTFGTPVKTDIKADTSVKALADKYRQDTKDVMAGNLAKTGNKTKAIYDEVFYSTMPVAGTHNTKHHMPAVKPSDADPGYKMPVKRIQIVDIVKKTKTINP
jgi:hypothetical protein